MNFFEHQDSARKRSQKLVWLFLLSVIAINVVIYLLVAFAFHVASQDFGPDKRRRSYDSRYQPNDNQRYNSDHPGQSGQGGTANPDTPDTPPSSVTPPTTPPTDPQTTVTPTRKKPKVAGVWWWNPEVLIYTLVCVLLVILIGSLYKMSQLSGGGASVAAMLGGKPVLSNTGDPLQRKLLNVVEEMAIASGMPVPQVFIMDEEPGINAFAAGTSASNAAIGVTRGAVEKLSRDELQGVIAHEFSHILHGDMKLNIRLIGVLHGILAIGIIGGWLIRAAAYSRGGRRDGRAVLAMIAFGCCLWIIGAIGLFFGRWIKAAVSRQREYLADAAAVQYTRNPEGIAGALKKIGGFSDGSQVVNRHYEEASHMFFGSVLSGKMMATHPPLEDRIKRIDPRFDGKIPPVPSDYLAPLESNTMGLAGQTAARGITPPDALQQQRPTLSPATAQAVATHLTQQPRVQQQPVARPQPQPPASRPPVTQHPQSGAQAPREIHTSAQAVTASIGQLTIDHLTYAARLLASIPTPITLAAREPLGAEAVIFGLLLDHSADVRLKQMNQLRSNASPKVLEELTRLFPAFESLDVAARLPLIDMAIPALRQMSLEQFNGFVVNLQALIAADNRIDIFEYCLHKMLYRHLRDAFVKQKPEKAQYHSLSIVVKEAAMVVAVLAIHGHDELQQAQLAFSTAMQSLLPNQTLPGMPDVGNDLSLFDSALALIARAQPMIKEKVLNACSVCAAMDGVFTIEEAELVRAIADTLGCPIPPILPTKV